MSPTPVPRPSTRPRWITRFDASRCYVLYDDVECTIPRWGTVGEYGAWDWSRGLLVELHRRLGGTPLSLHYQDLLTRHRLDPPDAPEHLPVGIDATATLRDRAERLITVVSTVEHAPYGPRGDYWQLTINGSIPASGEDPALDCVSAHPPTLPFQAFLVEYHLSQGGLSAADTGVPAAPAITGTGAERGYPGR